jgi:uncharacterized phage-associated protein
MNDLEDRNTQDNQIASVLDIANWFIITSSKEEDYTDMTNMKVNKLCFLLFQISMISTLHHVSSCKFYFHQ